MPTLKPKLLLKLPPKLKMPAAWILVFWMLALYYTVVTLDFTDFKRSPYGANSPWPRCSRVIPKVSNDFPLRARDNDQGHTIGSPDFGSIASLVYISTIAVYTALILAGLFFLWYLRGHDAVRVRGLGYIALAVCAIHVYVAALFIVYPLNGDFHCNEEFWYMTIVFPLGVALFYVSNIKLLAVSDSQEQCLQSNRWMRQPIACSWRPRQFYRWYAHLDSVVKCWLWIFVTMLAQVSSNESFQPSST